MGRTHALAYDTVRRLGDPVELRAVCDARPAGEAGTRGNLPLAEPVDEAWLSARGVELIDRYESMLARDDLDLISVCTPTPTHVDLARRALESGRHVLVEKPVALQPSAIDQLAEAAERANRLCMPAMCMRFWPGWSWLLDRVATEPYGPIRSASFLRIGAAPTWSPGFYLNPEQSGGPLVDLHTRPRVFGT